MNAYSRQIQHWRSPATERFVGREQGRVIGVVRIMARLGRVPVWFRRRRMGLGPSSIAKEVNTYMEIGFSLVFNFDPGSAMCVDH
jgi:hypothetical protein